MKKTLLFKCFIALALVGFTANWSNAQVRITEAMSNSGSSSAGATNDWFELTNLGTTAIDITGWKMDDSSYALANAVALSGVTSIPAGKSVIFLETDNPTTDISAFKTFWGTSLDAVSIGYYPSSGKGVGLSSSGDGVIIFDASGTEINRVTVPAATTGSSFYWIYKADATYTVQTSNAVSSVGSISGVSANQVTITSLNALANVGSPGTAVVGGLVTRVNDVSINALMKLAGNLLSFVTTPKTDVNVYSVTGSRVATYAPAQTIELNLQKGVYIVQADNQTAKIMLK